MDFDISSARAPSLLRRLGALVYDGLLLIGILMVANAILAIPYEVITGSPMYEHFLPLNLLRLYLLAVIAIFFVYFWTHGGQTLGMRAWRLCLVGEDGRIVGTGTALKRFGWAIIAIVPFGWGLWWCLFDKDHLAWHDRQSKTRLVLLQND